MESSNMSSMPIRKLILSTSLPVMLSLCLQAVYNIVDSAFVGNMSMYGEEGINALTLAFPVQMMIVALCIGTGVGACVLVSRHLGQNEEQQAKQVTMNTIFLGFILMILILAFGIWGVEAYIASQTDNPIIYEMAVNYLKICCIINVGSVFFAVFEKLLQSTGRSLYSTIAQVTGAVVNMILDPILIYGWLGFDAMGIKGAAYATVIGQAVAFVLALIFHIKYNKHINGNLRTFRPSWDIIKRIYILGIPAIIAQALISVMAYSLNVIFVLSSEAIVTVYGLYYKIQQFVILIVFGLRDATMPIMSYSYGTKNKQRLKECTKYVLLFATSIMIVGTILFELLAGVIASMFNLSGETYLLCISAIRIVSISFVFSGFNTACQALFQAIDSGAKSLIISVLRQIILVLPVAYVFTMLSIADYTYVWTIWLTFVIAESITAVIALIMLMADYKNKINMLALDTNEKLAI